MELTPEEARVLGCLMEKARTTPDAYPLSVNALVAACNQTTNRHPVVAYDEATVERALDGLRERGLVRREMPRGGRAVRFAHLAAEALALDEAEEAVLGVLVLRGAQTPGELKARTERWHRFGALEEVEQVLGTIAGREPAMVERLAREPGRKEHRWRHLLTAAEAAEAAAAGTPAAFAGAPGSGLGSRSAEELVTAPGDAGVRLAALEAAVRSLRDDLEALRRRLDG